MKELVLDIAKALVDNPDAVVVEETRKDDEIRQLVTEINVRLNKLKILGYTPFDKEVVEQLDKTRLITGLGLNTDNNHRVLDVYFNTIKIED